MLSKIESVDIYQYPSAPHYVADNTEVVIGDVHGNVISLLYSLIWQGIATIDQNDFEDLVWIYQLPFDSLESNDLKRFNELLDKISFNTTRPIKFLGDELADRGNNDYFTLQLIKRLSINHVPFQIILSNHNLVFLQAFKEYTEVARWPDLPSPSHYLSMINMTKLLSREWIDFEEIKQIKEIVTTHYRKALVLFDYSINVETQTCTIYTHAPAGLNSIEAIAEKLQVPFPFPMYLTLNDLLHVIRQCNFNFHTHFLGKNFGQLLEDIKPFTENRIYTDLDQPLQLKYWGKLTEPVDFSLTFVHGHDFSDSSTNRICLDNYLGKTPDIPSSTYVYYSFKLPEHTPKVEQIIQALNENSISMPTLLNIYLANPSLQKSLLWHLALNHFTYTLRTFLDLKLISLEQIDPQSLFTAGISTFFLILRNEFCEKEHTMILVENLIDSGLVTKLMLTRKAFDYRVGITTPLEFLFKKRLFNVINKLFIHNLISNEMLSNTADQSENLYSALVRMHQAQEFPQSIWRQIQDIKEEHELISHSSVCVRSSSFFSTTSSQPEEQLLQESIESFEHLCP